MMSMNLSASELEVAQSSSFKNACKKKFLPTPAAKKTKSKVKLNDGKRFLNNPYYAGTPLAPLRGNQTSNAASQQQQQQYHQEDAQESSVLSCVSSASQEGSNQDQETYFTSNNVMMNYQPIQPKFFQEQIIASSSNQESFDHHDSFFSAISENTNNNGSYAQQQQQQQYQQRQSSSFYGYPQQQQGQTDVYDNFSFTSQNFMPNTTNNNTGVYQNDQCNASTHSRGSSTHDFHHHHSTHINSASTSYINAPVVVSLEQHQQQQQPIQPRIFAVHSNTSSSQQQQQQQLPPLPVPASKQHQQHQNEQEQQEQQQKETSYPPNTSFVVVMFKHELCTFQCSFFVVDGDWVVVQADRGEHVGRVRSVSREPPAFHVPSSILRHANFAEISSVEANHAHEDHATQRIQQIVDELQLPNLRITDTEFYSDGNKMTVFFTSKTTVDFRELQRRVFREFRRRIWLINTAEVQYRNRNCRNRK